MLAHLGNLVRTKLQKSSYHLKRSATGGQLGLVIEFAYNITLRFEFRFEVEFGLAFDSNFRFEETTTIQKKVLPPRPRGGRLAAALATYRVPKICLRSARLLH